MINENYFVSRIVGHFNPEVDHLGTKRHRESEVQKVSENSVHLYGVNFSFHVDKTKVKKELEVVVSDVPGLGLEVIKTRKFWKDPSLLHVREKRNQYKYLLKYFNISCNGAGNYHFKAELDTNNEDKAFFAVLNCIVKPVLYLNLKNKR